MLSQQLMWLTNVQTRSAFCPPYICHSAQQILSLGWLCRPGCRLAVWVQMVAGKVRASSECSCKNLSYNCSSYTS